MTTLLCYIVQLEISVVLNQAAFFSPKYHILHIVHPWHNVTLRSSINRKQYITTLSVAGMCSWPDISLPHCLIHSLLDVLCITCNDQSCRKHSCLKMAILAVCLLTPKILSLPPWRASTDCFTSYFWSYCHFFKLCAGHPQLLWYISLLIAWSPKFSSSLSMQRHISGCPWSLSPQASQGRIPTNSSCVLTGDS